MNQIFKSDSVTKITKRGEKEKPQKPEGYKSSKKKLRLIQKLLAMTGTSQIYSAKRKC